MTCCAPPEPSSAEVTNSFQTSRVFSTSYTNSLLLPKPNVPILMSPETRESWLFLLGSSATKRAFPTCDVTHPDVAFSTGQAALFPLHQLSAQTPVAAGLLHTRSPLRPSPRQVRFLWLALAPPRSARDIFCLLAGNRSLRQSARSGSGEFPGFCLSS